MGEGWTSEVHVRDGSADAHQHPDTDPPDSDLEGALATAEGFLAAWLTDDQRQRRQLLTGIAAPTLVDSFSRCPLHNRRRLAARANPRAVCVPAAGHHTAPPRHRRRRRPHTRPGPCQPARLDRHQGHRTLITPSHQSIRVQTTVTTSQHDDSYPWTWEPAAAALAALGVAGILSLQIGRALALAIAGHGWLWPASSFLITSSWGIITGNLTAGLPPLQGTCAPPWFAWTAAAMIFVATTAGLFVVAVRWRASIVHKGMADTTQAERLLGLSRLKTHRAVIRPDLYRTGRR